MKNHYLVFILFVFWGQKCQGGDVICPLEDYILTGLEFSKCQKEVLTSFSPSDDSKGSQPCAELKNVVDNCATIVQVRKCSVFKKPRFKKNLGL